MLGIESLLVWALLRDRRGARVAGEGVRPKELTTGELEEAQARALPERMPSVTEQTARAFEPVYCERISK
jgi:hypothetical protein